MCLPIQNMVTIAADQAFGKSRAGAVRQLQACQAALLGSSQTGT